MAKAIPVDVTFPESGETRTFRSIRAVARMLSGTGTESGGFRKTISARAANGFVLAQPDVVRHNRLADAWVADPGLERVA